MDIYPESERCPEALKAQKSHDQFMDYIGLNPKNELSHRVNIPQNNKVYQNCTQSQLKNPYNPLKFTVCRDFVYYSSSMVPGGLLVRS